MPIKNRLSEMQPEIAAWRRDLHENPELMYEVHRTAATVAAKLREFGCDEVVEGIGRTGVVGVIKGRTDTRGHVVGLRADMDALPILEATGLPYASKTPGKMHACGHDGHTAMLLGAAKYLAETRNFDGAVAVIFQPAEEGGAGGRGDGQGRADPALWHQGSVRDAQLPRSARGAVFHQAGCVLCRNRQFHRASDWQGWSCRLSAPVGRYHGHGMSDRDDAANHRLAQRRSAGIAGGVRHLVQDGKRGVERDPRAGRVARHGAHF